MGNETKQMISVPREWLDQVALLQMPLDELQEQAIEFLCEPCDEQPTTVAVVPDLTELREYHAKAARDLEHYADDSGLRESDVKHYRKRAEFHRRQVELIDSLNTN